MCCFLLATSKQRKDIILIMEYTQLSLFSGVPHFIVFHFIAFPRYCIFYKLKVCGNPALSKPTSAIFPIAFAHFMSLCHILVILSIFQTFS